MQHIQLRTQKCLGVSQPFLETPPTSVGTCGDRSISGLSLPAGQPGRSQLLASDEDLSNPYAYSKRVAEAALYCAQRSHLPNPERMRHAAVPGEHILIVRVL